MLIKYRAKISYNTKDNHPDQKNIKDLSFSDTYTIDDSRFYGEDHILDYIKEDLMLVAGGGYDIDTISNVKFNINRV